MSRAAKEGSLPISPEELASLTGGVWRDPPARWQPSGVVQRAPKRKNPPYSPDVVNLLPDQAAVDAAIASLSSRSAELAGGCAVVPLGTSASSLDALRQHLPCLRADPAIDWLQALAVRARTLLPGGVAIVTGTAGKTSVRGMLASVLEDVAGPTVQNRENWNFKPHVLEALASAHLGTMHAVFEVGLGQKGVGLDESSRALRPTVGLLTNVGAAHRDVVATQASSPTLADVLAAKLAAFDGLPDGARVLISDTVTLPAWARTRLSRLEVVRFGQAEDSTYRLVAHQHASDGTARAVFAAHGTAYQVDLMVAGRHMATNALAVVAAADDLGVPVADAVAAVGSFSTRGNRLRITSVEGPKGRLLVVDDHFNCNLVSLDAGLRTARELADARGGRAVALLGDLISHSVWGDPRTFYADVARLIRDHRIEVVGTFGPEIGSLHASPLGGARSFHAPSRKSLRTWVTQEVLDNDVLLLKASKEMEFAKLSRFLRRDLQSSR